VPRDFYRSAPTRASALSCPCHMARALYVPRMTTVPSRNELTVALYHPYPARMGGSQLVTLRLARDLPSLGYRPILICPQDGALPDAARRQGIAVLICSPHERWRVFGTTHESIARWLSASHLWTLWRYWNALRRDLAAAGIDVLHCHDARGCLMAAPAARMAGIPSIWHLHLLPASGARRLLDAALALVSDYKVFVSNAARRAWTLPQWLLGADEVIANGLDPAAPAPIVARTDSHRVLLSVGALRPAKGQDLLLQAVAIVRQRVPNVRLRIAGEDWAGGNYRARLLTDIAALKLADCVELLGQRTDIASLMAAADACVIPSRSESFGLVALEAMQQSKPVVAFAVGGLQEIVVHEQTGLLVPPENASALADALIAVLTDSARAAAMGAAGLQRVEEHFSARKMAGRFAALYERLARSTLDRSVPSGVRSVAS
jgi:glycosyltransferase involved in cell wall biosynthesis